VDKITVITWMPDDNFIDRNSGLNANVSSASLYYPDSSELATLRYFPDSRAKNCYSFPVTPNTIYQIRGTFFYGLYDHRSTVPSFEMVVDGTIVASINFTSRADLMAYQEVSYAPQSNLTYLCLSRDLTNSVPFISAISLVLANYQQSGLADVMTVNIYEGFYYLMQFRWNFGGNGIIRYPDDPVDHYWFPIKGNSSYIQSTIQPVETLTAKELVNVTFAPSVVMNTALTTDGNMTIDIPFTHSYGWYMIIFFSELDPNATANSREFYLEVTSARVLLLNLFESKGEVLGFTANQIHIDLYKNQSISTPLGPLVNALAVFQLGHQPMALLTNKQDTLAIEEIKSSYGNLGVWTGDPCFPYPHPWLTCSNITVLGGTSQGIV
jgi:hypothetical protein